MGDGRDGVDVRDVAVGVAQGLKVNGLGVGLDGAFQLGQIVRVYKGRAYPKLRQGVGQQIIAAAIDGFLRHDVLPRLGQRLDGIGNGRGARGGRKRRSAPPQGPRSAFPARPGWSW